MRRIKGKYNWEENAPDFHVEISPIDGFSMEGCGSVVGCWFHPPKCEETIERCKSSARWSIDGDGVSVQLEATVTGLAPDAGHYLALGFSQDQRMVSISQQERAPDSG